MIFYGMINFIPFRKYHYPPKPRLNLKKYLIFRLFRADLFSFLGKGYLLIQFHWGIGELALIILLEGTWTYF